MTEERRRKGGAEKEEDNEEKEVEEAEEEETVVLGATINLGGNDGASAMWRLTPAVLALPVMARCNSGCRQAAGWGGVPLITGTTLYENRPLS